MRRCVFGLLLPLFLGCAGKNTVAGEDKTKAEQLESSLPSWCKSTCTRLEACGTNSECDCSGDVCSCGSVGPDCTSDCEKAFSGFIKAGEDCAAVGQRFMSCIDHATCDDLNSSKGCQPTDAERAECPGPDDSDSGGSQPPSAGTGDGPSQPGGTGGSTGSSSNGSAGAAAAPSGGPPVTGPLVSCGSGSGGGMAPTPDGTSPPSGIICEETRQDCTDGHAYSWFCSRSAQGDTACSCLLDSNVTGAFALGATCPDMAAVNANCHWNLSADF
jgi:hypothetical protein